MKRTAIYGGMALAALLLVPELAAAQSRTFRVRRDGGSRVTFVSDAPLETINGVSARVEGEINVDIANLSTARARVTVPVNTLRTGIDLRDEHLRGDGWLDAANHPNITFELTRIEGATSLTPGQAVDVRFHGRVTIHGVTKNVVARGRVQYTPLSAEMQQSPGIDGDVIRFRAQFTVQLSDFNVAIPLPVRLKVSNEITVGINARAIAER